MKHLAIIAIALVITGCQSGRQQPANIGVYNHFEQDSKSFVVSGGTQVQAQIRPEKLDKSAEGTSGGEADKADQLITMTNNMDAVKSARETDTSALLSQVQAKQAQAGIQSSEARRDSSASGSKSDANAQEDALKLPVAVTGQGNADSKVEPEAPKQ